MPRETAGRPRFRGGCWTAARGGRILIPAFALGRTQEIVYALHDLHRHGKIPDIPIYIDSPLAIDAIALCRQENPNSRFRVIGRWRLQD